MQSRSVTARVFAFGASSGANAIVELPDPRLSASRLSRRTARAASMVFAGAALEYLRTTATAFGCGQPRRRWKRTGFRLKFYESNCDSFDSGTGRNGPDEPKRHTYTCTWKISIQGNARDRFVYNFVLHVSRSCRDSAEVARPWILRLLDERTHGRQSRPTVLYTSKRVQRTRHQLDFGVVIS